MDLSTGTATPRNSDSLAEWQARDDLLAGVGKRYADCRLANFKQFGSEAERVRQRAALRSLQKFCDEMTDVLESGRNLFLHGPVGNGKDHLMVAVMRIAFRYTPSCWWTNGVDIFTAMRDTMDRGETRESHTIGEYTRPQVLAISDPVPPSGRLTEYQATVLFQIIDRRYRDCKPTFVTANFKDGKDAANRVGAQVIDRLKHGALSIHCDWPSYRETAK